MPSVDLLKKIYRGLSWGAAVALVLILILVLRKSPPPPVAYDPAAASRVEQKLMAADEAEASGKHAEVQLDSTELNSYLAQNLQVAGAKQPTASPEGPGVPVQPAVPLSAPAPVAAAPQTPGDLSADGATIEQVQSAVKDVKVDMDGDLVKAYVTFDFHGQDMSLELDGHLGSQDGYLKFDPVAGKLGEMPLPQSVLDSAVAKLMDSPENREKLRLPNNVSDIHIADGQAVVSYK
jgi:hypothetical protein